MTILLPDCCLKCNICTASCPVAQAAPLFPGPKYAGPQAERFRTPGDPLPDAGSLDYCTGCGVCTRVCPHEVPVAELIARARGRYFEKIGLPLRNRLLSRPETLGRWGSAFAPLSNIPLILKPARRIMEAAFKIDRRAALPRFARPTFRAWFRQHVRQQPAPEEESQARGLSPLPRPSVHKVLYFHGCSTNYYEPWVGKAAVAVLRHNGCEVTLGQQNCCGLPAQANGDFRTLRHLAESNVRKLAPYIRQGYAVVGTSTSCVLNMKHEYRAIAGLSGEDVDLLAANVYDIFEYLWMLYEAGELRTDFQEMPLRIPYHPPCQLTNHGIGHPATRLLGLVPGLEVVETGASCCGGGGTYSLKVGKYAISQAVGQEAFRAIESVPGDRALCDSETCRWWLGGQTGRRMQHPVELLAEVYGLGGE
jgi:glycerol-3-phosphate dehydrogenase subunit C